MNGGAPRPDNPVALALGPWVETSVARPGGEENVSGFAIALGWNTPQNSVVTLGQLPVGPSVGAAAAGVPMTVTGTIGGLLFAAWAGADRLWSGSRNLRRVEPVPARAPAGS